MHNNQLEIVLATEKDNDKIRNLFANTTYNTMIDMQFRRGENPFSSFMQEDDGAVVLLLKKKESQDVIAMGACYFHEIYLDGEIKRENYCCLRSIK